MEEETYEVEVECENCGVGGVVEIPKGQPIERFVSAVECPNCGCEELCKAEFFEF